MSSPWFSGTLMVHADMAEEAEVRVHAGPPGHPAIAAINVEGLKIQSYRPGPLVLADFLEALAARVREKHTAFIERTEGDALAHNAPAARAELTPTQKGHQS